jgi:diacylglycerol kinase family enzyme
VSVGKRGGGRVAALVALVAGVTVVVALVVLVFRDAVSLLFALAALAVVGAAGWFALSRRGLARVLAVALVIVALAGGGTELFLRGSVDELVALAAALAVFAGATRIALRRAAPVERSSLPAASRRSGPGAARGKAVLLMNPRSGGGKVERFDLVGEARRRGIEPIVLAPSDDLRALAREAAGSAEVIGMAGGDGSQALVAQVAMEHEVAHVCVPAGTRNHLALDLGLDRDDVVGALDAFTNEAERQIDVAFVNERLFVNNVSLGVYAEIVRSEAYRDAKLETMQQMLPELLGPRASPFDLRFRSPERGEHRSAQLLLVSNNPYRLDRIGGVGSRPRLDSGLLGIVAVEVTGAARAAELVSLQALGQVRRFHGWSEWTAERFEVASDRTVAAGIDGEAIELEPPLQFRIEPAALRIRLPPTAAGLSPAALAPGVSTAAFRGLWEIAAGRH